MTTKQTCASCGQPSLTPRCPYCSPAGALVSPDKAERLAVLNDCGTSQRAKVVLAFLRAGVLLQEQDAPCPLLLWLLRVSPTIVFVRWLAEDSVYGDLALPLLAGQKDRHEIDRSLLRAPLWLVRWSHSDLERAHPLIRSWICEPRRLYALGSRLGACLADMTPERRDSSFARFLSGWTDIWGWLGLLAMHSGKKNPKPGIWSPNAELLDRSTTWRRWPLERLEGGCVLVCTICAENLPAHGPCRYCGCDPEEEPPSLLPIADLLVERSLCPHCGFDLCTRAVPARCGCCGASLRWNGATVS